MPGCPASILISLRSMPTVRGISLPQDSSRTCRRRRLPGRCSSWKNGTDCSDWPCVSLMTLFARGACYYSTSNNDCPQGGVLDSSTRNSNIKTWASQITAAGLSWLYWQAIPNADPHVSPDNIFCSNELSNPLGQLRL